jgi:hypothetical protein
MGSLFSEPFGRPFGIILDFPAIDLLWPEALVLLLFRLGQQIGLPLGRGCL